MGRLQGKALMNSITVLAAVGFLLFGYDQGVMSGITDDPTFLRKMGLYDEVNQKVTNPALLGAIVSLYEIGCMAGALSCGWVGDRLGRKKTIMIGCTILTIGGALQAGCVNIGMMIAARMITGVGNGLNTATIPVYQSEISPPKSRGAHVSFEASFLTLGVAIAYWLEYGLYFTTGEVVWRFPLAFQCFFGILLGVGVKFLPESPRWLQAHDRDGDCKQVLADLWTDGDTTHPRCVGEWEEIRDGIELERREGVSTYKELFSKGKMNNRYRVYLGMMGQIIQQFGGINLISYYLATVFSQAGMDPKMSRLMSGVDSIVYFIGALCPIFLIERVGRRKLMFYGLIGQAICMFLIGAGQAAYKNSGIAAGASVSIAFTMLYNFVFGSAWLGLAWLYPAEIFGTGLRAKGNSMSTAANWLGNFVVAEVAPVCFDKLDYWTYILFGFVNIIFLPLIYFGYPETKGLSLEEIEVLFATQEVQDDARTIASHIGSHRSYDPSKPRDPETASRFSFNGRRSSRPATVRQQSHVSNKDVHLAHNRKEEIDTTASGASSEDNNTAAAQVKQEYQNENEKGPNYQ
ncbi:hypothetical protein BC943DRAFT_280746 [Umbelopsis sp. AD052]|nr:hypothetical protein BC943DRAFT_280746 [Umbelopsis sp. AD052]